MRRRSHGVGRGQILVACAERRPRFRWLAVAVLAQAAVLPLPFEEPARAAVIVVESTSDAGGIAIVCRLRNAILAANGDSPSGACPAGNGADTIDLRGLSGTIPLGSALPAITGDASILGPGADQLAVSGQDASRVFLVTSGAVAIEGLTVRDGLVSGSNRGGGIAVQGGSLALRDCRVTSSRAFNGGGIDVMDGAARIERCLVDGNETTGNSGAGIANVRSLVEIQDSTIAGNVAGLPDDPQVAVGGGLTTVGAPSVPALTRLHGVTLAANGAESDANLWVGDDASVELSHTIVGLPAAGTSCSAGVVSAGYNIDEAGTCGLGAPSDRVGSALLQPGLLDNGGPTPTRAPLPGSPAIDAGAPAGCLDADGVPRTRDQRGSPRPTDGNGDGSFVCDIGAVEAFGAPEPGSPGAAATALALAWLARRRSRRTGAGVGRAVRIGRAPRG